MGLLPYQSWILKIWKFEELSCNHVDHAFQEGSKLCVWAEGVRLCVDTEKGFESQSDKKGFWGNEIFFLLLLQRKLKKGDDII